MVDLKKSKETLLTAHEDTNTIQSDVKERALQQSIEIRIDQSVDFKEYTFDILQNMINQINGFQYVSIE
ncbi:unnamed protein product [Paramecium pentaurelia]|uniref:Uncharacterized protein n=1 Tax=Paramecium pentaurelia TaxID=43138 RepID=A0A8S1Y9J0_9CILI|nr:unnamed protein product [Paramecium pentaurelia]